MEETLALIKPDAVERNIIGNIILDIDVQNLSNVLVPVDLIKQNMYIVRIETSQNRIITRKIVAR